MFCPDRGFQPLVPPMDSRCEDLCRYLCTRGVFPVARGTSVGGNGLDIDDGWDQGRKKWIKNPGRLSPEQLVTALIGSGLLIPIYIPGAILLGAAPGYYSGHGEWGEGGKFDPAPGPGSGTDFPTGNGDPHNGHGGVP